MSNPLPTSILLTLLLAATTALSGACSQTDKGTSDTATAAAPPSPADIPGISLCTDPRPEICTQQYAPVCGVRDDGSRRTYSNACSACADTDVVGSLAGACPD